jgi:hypothetical protein
MDGANAPVNGRSGWRQSERRGAFESPCAYPADSDNARQTVPATEIVSDWSLVMLAGEQGNVGERYGRSFEHPLVATVSARHS